MQIISYAIAAIIPLIVLAVIYALDLYKMGEFRSVLLCFAWGLAAYGLAYYVNSSVYRAGWLNRSEIVRYFAPFAEEILKALILVYLVRRPNFTYFVDGAIYGFAAGMGFAVIENYQYILATPSAGLGTAIARVLSVNLIHASATALVGVALGLARFRRTGGHILLLLGGLFAAMVLHSLFNNINDRQIPGPILLYSTVIGLAAVGLIAFLIFRGLAEQKLWIREKLGMADRVTGSEARAVDQIVDAGTFLEPLAALYGQEKAEQIEQFLFMQARLGILRKTLDKLPDEKMRTAVEKQMDELRQQMDEIRRKVGSYCMASVRLIFPPDDTQLFRMMEARIQQVKETRAASGGGGANWMTALQQRAAQKPAAPEEESSHPKP
ncbi:MAG: PrsW family intramembrane metalloprotease [Anaerolineales bacterium]|nr:PrsW family intramembrane metalloprotease [Anaerolineales bacterium]